MKTLLIVSILSLVSGCATNNKSGYMMPACQNFHDKGRFDLWAQCSQSIRNVESQVSNAIVMKILKK